MSQTVITAIAVAGMLAANGVFFLSFVWLATEKARQEGFQRGVVEGWIIGRFPEHAYIDCRFKQACAITDGLEADVMWCELNGSKFTGNYPNKDASNEG